MDIAKKKLKKDERATLYLSALYESYGYQKYKMSKFEEYDLYLENKSFLKSEGIITFNDMNGKLLALKPDVTLSIVKNAKEDSLEPQKLFYTENVYRTVRKTHEFKEIMQVGLEYIGEVDLYSLCEVIGLATKSLAEISEEHIMDISHIGFVSGILDSFDIKLSVKEELLPLIATKNAHEIIRVCTESGIPEEAAKELAEIPLLRGSFRQVLSMARKMAKNKKSIEAVEELESIYRVLSATGEAEHINLDFSVMNDISYYNGVIFQGYVKGVPCNVLSGGRYDSLMHKMGKRCGAVGFAVYLDLLDLYDTCIQEYDVDILLLYRDSTPAERVACMVKRLTDEGKSVRTQKNSSDGIKYRRLIDADREVL